MSNLTWVMTKLAAGLLSQQGRTLSNIGVELLAEIGKQICQASGTDPAAEFNPANI